MATVTPTTTTRTNHVTYEWTGAITGDTISSVKPDYSLVVASIVFSGTFSGGTVAILQGSNDDTNWVTVNDTSASNVSATAAAGFELSTAFAYYRINVASGSADSITGTIVSWK